MRKQTNLTGTGLRAWPLFKNRTCSHQFKFRLFSLLCLQSCLSALLPSLYTQSALAPPVFFFNCCKSAARHKQKADLHHSFVERCSFHEVVRRPRLTCACGVLRWRCSFLGASCLSLPHVTCTILSVANIFLWSVDYTFYYLLGTQSPICDVVICQRGINQ